jgi:nucleotide-binding universal stress UspA family protein
MYKRILIPTDGSDFAERAVSHGVALAKALGAQIVGLNVTQPLHTGTPRALIPPDIAALIRSETAKLADEHLCTLEQASTDAGVAVETVRESRDHPWEGILHTATEKECDLIVMASHGRSGVKALILGSQAQKVLTHSTIPVLVVR